MIDHNSAGFGNVPNTSESFGNIRNDAEGFRSFRNGAERTEQHTLTVREVARLFEEAGVPRTERSIINWCQVNRQGIARLDAYFDMNERKYFITPQSVVLAIREEQAKGTASGIPTPEMEKKAERKAAETAAAKTDETETIKIFELKVRDLEITNRAKDYFIEQLKSEREGFQQERREYVERLVASSREAGELLSQLLLLGSAPQAGKGTSPHRSEVMFEPGQNQHAASPSGDAA